MSLRIATYNVRRGGWPRRHALVRVLRGIDPDLAVLQEATDATVVADLAGAIGGTVVLQAPGRSVAVVSRVEWRTARWHTIAPSRTLAEIELASGLRVVGAHLSAGLSRRGERRREVEAAGVLRVIDGGSDAPVVIAGDLNAIAPGDKPVIADLPGWIRILLRLDGGIGTAVLERLLSAGYVDAFRDRNPDAPGTTMPAADPTVRLDYVLLDPRLAPALAWCRVWSAGGADLVTASDHLPVVAELELPAG